MEDTSTPLYDADVVPLTLAMTDDNTLSTGAIGTDDTNISIADVDNLSTNTSHAV